MHDLCLHVSLFGADAAVCFSDMQEEERGEGGDGDLQLENANDD